VFRAPILRAALVTCATAVSGSCSAQDQPMNLPFDPAPLIVDAGETEVTIKVEVADNAVERSRGLMFRDRLPDGQGMLFVFQDEDFQSFWMKNTPQPLDIIYIEADGDIVSIHDAKALDDTPIPSTGPAKYVLEIAAGEAKRLGIDPGEKVRHPLIQP
jgi:uncharacterized protein